MAGNLISDSRLTHTYDARGRLVQTVVPDPGGTTLTYKYNDQNQRVGLWDSAANSGKVWLYDEEGRMLAEYTTGGARVHELMWLGSTPVAVAGTLFTNCGTGCSGIALAYIWTDHLDTPRAITDQGGIKVWEWESAPFGETAPIQTSSRGTMVFNHRFAGQYFDSKTGLHQNVNRDFDPKIGRYVQSDPIGLKGGSNLYSYANNNPTRFSDPLGLSRFDKFFGLPRQFWHWYHKQKGAGDPDLPSRREAIEWHKEWVDLGKPKPDHKRNQRGSADEELLEWLIPWPFIPSDLACSDLDCDKNGIPDFQERKKEPCN